MEVQFSFNERSKAAQPISLRQLVTEQASQFQSLALQHRSILVNDVAADLLVSTDKNILASVIASLLRCTVNDSRSSDIRITAKRYNNIILLRVRDSNTAFSTAPYQDWKEINRLAGKLGGCIIEDDIRKKHATVTLSFCSMAIAA
ncbi:MAG: hypothetical protein ABUT20_21220 [Bacteroidota bacterium]